MYVKTVGPASANIFIVGEAPGEYEDATGLPFQHRSGEVLDKLLAQTSISRNDCLVGNVARQRPPANNISFFFEDKNCTLPKPVMQKYLEELRQEIILYRPNIVLAMGRTALWALTGETKITQFRGYVMESTLVPGQKVLATYHPRAVLEEWKHFFTVVMDIRKAIRHSLRPEIPNDRRSFTFTPSRREFLDYLDYLTHNQNESIALDIETANPGCHPDIMGIAESPTRSMSIVLVRNREPVFNPHDELEIWIKIAELVKTKRIITHNGDFDIGNLYYNIRFLPRMDFLDTKVATHVIWPEVPRTLAYVSSICLDVPAWKHTQHSHPAQYNCADAANTFGIWNVLNDILIRDPRLLPTFEREMRQMEVAIMMQLQGAPVCRETQHKLLYGFTNENGDKEPGLVDKIQALNERIESTVGMKVNLNSPKQMATLLYGQLGLPEQYKRRKRADEPRKLTTDAEALEKLFRSTNNPVLKDILECKKLFKRSGFINTTVSPEGRIHTCYNVTGARMHEEKRGIIDENEEDHKSFGRWSSSKSIILPFGPGNLQNIPKPAREIYKAPPGYKYISRDYIQAEAVVVAYEIDDRRLISMFQESFGKSKQYRDDHHLDVHKLTGSMMFGISIDEVTKEQRQIGKTIRHANNYSAGPGVLARKLGISITQAKTLMNRYHSQCPELHLWHRNIQKQLEKNRTLVNLLGRKHRFTDRWGDELFRSAYSYIPQSTVGDLLNLALVRLYDLHGDRIDITFQLHDAIYGLVKEEDVKWGLSVMKECMHEVLTSSRGVQFAIDSDASVGGDWANMKEYDDFA